MIQKQINSIKGVMEITFELPSGLWADRIYVVGDFNEWNKQATPMRQGRDGVWRATINVPLGRQFEFRYLIDGDWHTDYHADGSRTNRYGSENSVLDTTAPADIETEMEPVTVESAENGGASGQIIRLVPLPSPPTQRVLAAAA